MARFERRMPPHPLDGIVPTPTKEEADKIMSNLPVTKKDIPKFNKMLKSMGKTKKKKKYPNGFLGKGGQGLY
jgi:hypothetical protein